MTALRGLGAAETARLVARGDLTARQVTDAALERIELHDPRLNAISQRGGVSAQGRAPVAAGRAGLSLG